MSDWTKLEGDFRDTEITFEHSIDENGACGPPDSVPFTDTGENYVPLEGFKGMMSITWHQDFENYYICHWVGGEHHLTIKYPKKELPVSPEEAIDQITRKHSGANVIDIDSRKL